MKYIPSTFSVVFVSVLLFLPFNVMACDLEAPDAGYEYAIKVSAFTLEGEFLDQSYLEEFYLGADCTTTPPTLVRTLSGELILEASGSSLQQLTMENGEIVYVTPSYNLSTSQVHQRLNGIQTIVNDQFISVIVEEAEGMISLEQTNLDTNNHTTQSMDIAQYLTDNGFEGEIIINYRPSMTVSNSSILLVVRFATEVGSKWEYDTVVVNIDLFDHSISHSTLPVEFKLHNYEYGISSWDGFLVLGYSKYPDRGLHIFNQNLDLIEDIKTEGYGFDMFESTMIYRPTEEQDSSGIIYDLVTGNSTLVGFDHHDTYILNDFIVKFELGQRYVGPSGVHTPFIWMILGLSSILTINKLTKRKLR